MVTECPSLSTRQTDEPIIVIRDENIPLVKFVRTMRRKVFGGPRESAVVLRAFQTKLDNKGQGTVIVTPDTTAMEWDIYQISHRTSNYSATCITQLLFNAFFLAGTPTGWQDTATGPPDIVLRPGDRLSVIFAFGNPNDLATVSIFYNENVVGTTTSSAH